MQCKCCSGKRCLNNHFGIVRLRRPWACNGTGGHAPISGRTYMPRIDGRVHAYPFSSCVSGQTTESGLSRPFRGPVEYGGMLLARCDHKVIACDPKAAVLCGTRPTAATPQPDSLVALRRWGLGSRGEELPSEDCM